MTTTSPGFTWSSEDGLHRRLLALEDARRAGEAEDARVDAGGLHDAAVLGDVAVQHRQPAVLAVGVLEVADAAAVAVEVELAEALRWLKAWVVGTPPGAAR